MAILRNARTVNGEEVAKVSLCLDVGQDVGCLDRR